MTAKLSKVNRGSSLIEVTAAMAILVAVTFFVTLQDTSSMAQAQRDARWAVATLWLENEAALVRSSLPPWATNRNRGVPHLTLYPSQPSITNVFTNVPLIGDISSRLATQGTTNVAEYSSRFSNCVVRRVLVDVSDSGYDDLISATYRVEVELPHTLVQDGGEKTETLSRTVHRTFTGGGI